MPKNQNIPDQIERNSSYCDALLCSALVAYCAPWQFCIAFLGDRLLALDLDLRMYGRIDFVLSYPKESRTPR